MAENRLHSDRSRLVASVLLAPLAAGWLASGSCSVVGCYEECDPCFQQCKCSGHCRSPLAGAQPLRIVASSSQVVESDDARFVRVLDVAFGPTLEDAPRDDGAGPERCADFGRAILDANSDLFTSMREPVWRLAALERFPSSTAAIFTLDPERFARRSSVSVSLLFDARGRLLEATHVVDRSLD